MAPKVNIPKSNKQLPAAIVKQTITLSTSGFGLVAALAWNEVVKTGIELYVKPYLPNGSQFISLLIYALIVTTMAVVVTLQLTRIQHLLSTKDDN